MDEQDCRVIVEALESQKGFWEGFRHYQHANDCERELADLKIRMINQALKNIWNYRK